MKFLVPLYNPNAPSQKSVAEKAYVGRRAQVTAGTKLLEIRGNGPTRHVRCRKTRYVIIEGVTFVGGESMTLFWQEGRRRFYASSKLLELLPEGYSGPSDRLRLSTLAAKTVCAR
jgi:hypothetical protein